MTMNEKPIEKFTPAVARLREICSPLPVDRMTQKQLGDRLGVTPQAVSLWLAGKSKPDVMNQRRLRAEFGIEFEDWDDVPEAPVEEAPRAKRRKSKAA